MQAKSPHYRRTRAGTIRRLFRYLAEEHGGRRLSHLIAKQVNPRPRNVTATREEVDKLMAAAAPYMRCFILLCADLGIRSGTAVALGPEHFDPERRVLTFRTKYQAAQELPITATLLPLLQACNLTGVPFVSQLPRGTCANGSGTRKIYTSGVLQPNSVRHAFKRLCRSVGITRTIRPHDLRRTVARRVYRLTRDMNLVQALLGHAELSSTVWYLNDNTHALTVNVLEDAKLLTMPVIGGVQ